MPGRVTVTRVFQPPGLVIISKPAVITPFPPHALICHCHMSLNTTPLSLPVAASRLTLSTQHLIPEVKSLWVVRIRLILYQMCLKCHLSVPLRERQTCVCCVWVQCELTSICRQEERTSEYGVGKGLFHCTHPHTHTHTHTQSYRCSSCLHTNKRMLKHTYTHHHTQIQ